jgi:hypothetical protein
MVFGTGTERLMCAVPSLSIVVKSSAAGDWDRAWRANAAGRANNDAKDLLVMNSFYLNAPQ